MKIKPAIVGMAFLSGCALNQESMLNVAPIETFTSTKTAGEVAGCTAQRFNEAPGVGTDGKNFWVTRSSAAGAVVRYDFIPNPEGTGSIVQYRSKVRINNGLDKVKSCL